LYQKKTERGTKRACLNCGTRFYDLMRTPPVCPKCGTEFVAAVRQVRVPRDKQRWKSPGKGHPVPPREAEAVKNPVAGGHPSDDDDRETDAETEEDSDTEEESQTEDEEPEE